MDLISALVAGQYAATRQTTKLLGSRKYSILIEGDGDSLQLSPIAQRTILAIIFRGNDGLGRIRTHINQLATKLNRLFGEIADRKRKDRDMFEGSGPTPAPA